MWEPQPLTTLRASKACRGENFTFLCSSPRHAVFVNILPSRANVFKLLWYKYYAASPDSAVAQSELWVQSHVSSCMFRDWRSCIAEDIFSQFPLLSPANHYAIIAPFSFVTVPWGVWWPWTGSASSYLWPSTCLVTEWGSSVVSTLFSLFLWDHLGVCGSVYPHNSWKSPIFTRQRLGKHVPAATNTRVEHTYFSAVRVVSKKVGG
jgi:hypothetical protein